MRMPVIFAKLIHAIQPTASEVSAAMLHAATIKARLAKSFQLKKFLFIGSNARKSAIRSNSDLDLLAIFSRQEVKWGDGFKSSTTFIKAIRDDLDQRFTFTEVRRDQQAVVVHFGGGSQPVDVVPAIFWDISPGKGPRYCIPDGDGDWLFTAPEAHNKFLENADKASSGKLKRVAQLLKFWRNCREPNIPLMSFHLELLLATSHICIGTKSYAECLFDTFNLLGQRGCRGLHDPIGIAGAINAAKTETQENQLLSAVLYAKEHALRALLAEAAGDHKEAYRQWNVVFNGNLPYCK